MTNPIIIWFRRDLRISDHVALSKAIETGRPIIPVFICDPIMEALGAAPKWRFGLGVEHFAKTLAALGSRLILRRGEPLAELRDLIRETGADTVYWSRAYDTDAIARDRVVKAGLQNDGIDAQSHQGHVLFEPWSVANKSGGYFKVYTPFWKTVRGRQVDACLPAPKSLSPPSEWPESDTLTDWQLGRDMRRGADVVSRYICVGETNAQARLDAFLDDAIGDYQRERDFPNKPSTSRLSENLTYGEISPRMIWHSAYVAMQKGAQGGEHFLKELVWREYAYHLMYHFPALADQNWRSEWDTFHWLPDNENAERWRRGMTGEPMVDAAMRELYITGTMHNRMRMIAASYLTKHLRTDWRVGRDWFADCLIDWDPAANAMGWQWVAGCGPDASPYFRIFNPATQGEKFDKQQLYRKRFLLDDTRAEYRAFFAAIPKSWHITPSTPYPEPAISLADGRKAALDAYAAMRGGVGEI
ncbi:deoxyribodipyrimidine photolyase [Amylibacter kogurei]|uniref:Deoxyribodipyrimidine photolyase n=1 Tax=Paramylibacter kogurei TaxID=1889778 RepID=A0A2G5K9D0_9RHOB|nr:deoxyribodipyrimidine photo-lyase [Amylibacter kogurei]PIB25632.1 deoxyribodipyrimidine photolyase [Amylibacter kogurei]